MGEFYCDFLLRVIRLLGLFISTACIVLGNQSSWHVKKLQVYFYLEQDIPSMSPQSSLTELLRPILFPILSLLMCPCGRFA